jgi:transcription antitermination factor NusG
MFVNHLHETEPHWFAVRTRAKSEKFVQRSLAKKQVQAYVPLQKFVRRYTRSTRTVELPLIHGYVFVHILKAQYLLVLETENVLGFVRFNKDLCAVSAAEIEILRRVTLEDGLELTVLPRIFTEGTPVEIIAGNLIGMRGQVVSIEGKRTFLVELSSLGYSLQISVDGAFLGKLDKNMNK